MDQSGESAKAEKVIHWLKEATSKVGFDYFRLPIDGLPDGVFRERVYCYELYHQLRTLIPHSFGYSLGGEVDKSAHPVIKALGVRDTVPDLLVHRPGYMAGNLVIVEVKPTKRDTRAIQSDITKMSRFIETANYVKGAMLLYGPDEARVTDVAQNPGRSVVALDQMALLWHRSAGESARQIPWAA